MEGPNYGGSGNTSNHNKPTMKNRMETIFCGVQGENEWWLIERHSCLCVFHLRGFFCDTAEERWFRLLVMGCERKLGE